VGTLDQGPMTHDPPCHRLCSILRTMMFVAGSGAGNWSVSQAYIIAAGSWHHVSSTAHATHARVHTRFDTALAARTCEVGAQTYSHVGDGRGL
jgi:hypothetical protein